jgi:hypothetical protein
VNLHFSDGLRINWLCAVLEQKDGPHHQPYPHERDEHHPPNEHRIVDLEHWIGSIQ